MGQNNQLGKIQDNFGEEYIYKWFWYFKAVQLIIEEDLQEAITTLEKLNNELGRGETALRGEVHFLLGRCYVEQGQLELARKEFQTSYNYFLKVKVAPALDALRPWLFKVGMNQFLIESN